MIRAKVVGKKLVKEGPFGTLVYTIKQMKVSDIITGPRRDLGGGGCQKSRGQGRPSGWNWNVCLLSVESSRELQGAAKAAGRHGGCLLQSLHR